MGLELAKKDELSQIMQLYRCAVGSEGCTWSDEYPNEEIMAGDFQRNDLFVWKGESGELLGAISIDDDEEVNALPCWSLEAKPAAELARLVVSESYRNQGIARKMLQAALDVLKERGYHSAMYLVSGKNQRAVRSYAKLAFDKKGEADLFGEHWMCYEKLL